MSRPHMERSYSFEPNDETSLSAHRQPEEYSPYRDESPSRNNNYQQPQLPPSQQPSPAGYHYQNYNPPSVAPTPPLHRENPFNDSSEYNRSLHSSYTNSLGPGPAATPASERSGERGPAGGMALGAGSESAREGNSPSYFERYGPNSPYAPQTRSRAPASGYPVSAAAAGAGVGAAAWASNASATHSARSSVMTDHYMAQPVNMGSTDGPYSNRYSSPWDSRVDQSSFDPNDIDDDGDDGLNQTAQRRSMLNQGKNSNSSLPAATGLGAGAGGAAAGGAGAAAAAAAATNGFDEKGLNGDDARRRKKRMCFIILGVIAVLGIFAAAIIGGILGSRANNRNSGGRGVQGLSAEEDDGNGLLDSSSSEIRELLNNRDLKRVFPGMDYTPFNAQYPECLTNPPSQNNITRDMAVLSQLTKVVRLYGTDCNQTDMVFEAFDRLELTDMKVWLGVWLDNNATTNARSLRDMYTVMDNNRADRFAGVIIGNEILFRQDMTPAQLASIVADVRSNFTDRSIDLPIGVADLGDNWRLDGADFIRSVDVVMSNIHPFFAGVTAGAATAWTHNFWEENVVALTEDTSKQNIIAEVGWPSEGGNNCGAAECTSDTQGSVASIANMNTFMEDFVCQSLVNGTDYFWFEAFDEPWKQRFNEPGKEWEDKWGLMTPDRVMKPGLVIPDCDGQRIP